MDNFIITKDTFPSELVGFLIEKYDKEASAVYLREYYFNGDDDFKSGVIERLNENMRCGDAEILRCEFCNLHSLWGGNDGDPTLWSCQNCGRIFCENCAHVENENDEKILCGECR